VNIDLHIPGIPVAKGSARAYIIKGRARVTQTNNAEQRPWASAITLAARDAMQGEPPSRGPVAVRIHFWMPRPKSHYRTGKYAAELRGDAPYLHTGKPDLDKLIRCVLDALTGVCYQDDGQVCIVDSMKAYDKSPGVQIHCHDAETAKEVRGE